MAMVAYVDDCDVVHALDVSDEIAAVLAEPEHEDKAIPFSCLHATPDEEGLDLAHEEWLSTALRLYYRGQLARVDVSPWEGPTYKFRLLIGTGTIWTGPPHPGPCPCCGGRRLWEWSYCLVCDRSGRDYDIPPVPRDVWRRCQQAERERTGGTRRGRQLQGGRS